jgi:type IV secretory pathway TraG/TraD family ATPase VirD4
MAAIERQVIAKGDNLLFIDPKQGKGEIISWTLEYANEFGRAEEVRYYNPLYPEFTDYFNPIFGMKDEELVSSIKNIMQPNPNPSQTESFYLGFMEKTLMGILRGLTYLEESLDPAKDARERRLKEEMLNYIKIVEMRGHRFEGYDKENNIIFPDIAERLESQRSINQRQYAHVFNRSFITFKDLYYYAYFENLNELHETIEITSIPKSISSEKYGELQALRNDALMQLKGVLDKGQDYYESVSEGFRSLLGSLSTGRIGATFCKVRINPMLQELASKEKGFIGVFQTNPLKFKSTSEIMTKIIMASFESMFGRISGTGRENKRRLWVFIDEGEATLAPGIQGFLNKVGGIGGSLIIATQSGADFDYKLQPILARVAKDSINTTMIMKPNDLKSRTELAEFMGTVKMTKTQVMSDFGGVGGRSTTSTEEELVVTPTSLDRLDIGEGYIKHYGSRYKTIFPFVPDPIVKLEMPKLDEEILFEMATTFEKSLDAMQRKIKASSIMESENV